MTEDEDETEDESTFFEARSEVDLKQLKNEISHGASLAAEWQKENTEKTAAVRNHIAQLKP